MPVEKFVEVVLDHVGGGAVVEPRVELVDDRLEPDHGEQPRREPSHACQRCSEHGDGLLSQVSISAILRPPFSKA